MSARETEGIFKDQITIHKSRVDISSLIPEMMTDVTRMMNNI